MNGILVTNYDDWEALYIDGVLYTQDHKVSRAAIRKVKGRLYEQGINCGYTYEVGSLPDNYDDIPKDVLYNDMTDVDEE